MGVRDVRVGNDGGGVLGAPVSGRVRVVIFRRTRPLTGGFLVLFSYALGAATWLYATAITFAAFDWWGLFVGFVMAGLGVVVLGLIGAFLGGRSRPHVDDRRYMGLSVGRDLARGIESGGRRCTRRRFVTLRRGL